VPLPLPLSVYVWSGPIALWVWAAICVVWWARMSEFGWQPLSGRFMARSPDSTARVDVRHSALLAGALAAVALGFGTWSTAPHHPDGDEPHYLVITQSILSDFDLQIENNHRDGDYRAYVTRPLEPDFLKRGLNGAIYSIHAPGLSLLVAPAFALGGYAGVLVALVVMGAAASALVWFLAWCVTGDAAASWFGWATFTLSVPFYFHASALFPDGAGAVIMAVALLPLVDARARTPRTLVAVGAALSALPWLSSRFIPLAAMAALVIGARVIADRSRPLSRLAALAAVPLVGAAAFFLFYQLIYGTPNPSIVYGGAPSMSISAATLVRGVPGLLFDQQFGLFPNAPVYLCAVAGLLAMTLRGGRRLALELLLVALPYFLITASFTSWWGGTTAPARYVAPITPLLAVPAAFWFARASGVAMRTASLGALLVSLLMTATIASVDRGAFLFNFRDGMSRVALWLSPMVDLPGALPSMFQSAPPTLAFPTAAWLAAIAAALAVAAAVGRYGRAATVVGFGVTLEVAIMVAASAVWTDGAVVATPDAAGPALLQRYRPQSNQIAVAYRPFRRLDHARLLNEVAFGTALSVDAAIVPATRKGLRAGIYELTGKAPVPSPGRVRVKIDRASAPIAEWEVAAEGVPWTKQVTLPVDVAALVLDADPAALPWVRETRVRAMTLTDPPGALRDHEARDGVRYGSVVVFSLDGEAWMEPGGVWVAGSSNAEFALAPDGPSPVRLSINSGPVGNEVTLASGAWREQLTLAPGDVRVVEVPLDAGTHAAALTVAAASGFRPVDFDPDTEDERFLGVRIETR
jgi:hypothetical protein